MFLNTETAHGVLHHRPIRAGLVFVLCSLFVSLTSVHPVRADELTLSEWLDIGWDYYNIGNVDEAFNTFLEVIEAYPESAEARLSLAEMYLMIGETERGQDQILQSLVLDDETPIAARAHYLYAETIADGDPWNAMLHLERAHDLSDTPSLQFEIGRLMRFCRMIVQMTGRAESGPVTLHFHEYLLFQNEADEVAQDIESALYLAETYCYFDLTRQFHIFLHPSEYNIRSEIFDPADDRDPEHREFHVVYDPDYNYLGIVSEQVVMDLQDEMNRHAGERWVVDAMPYAIDGRIPWSLDTDVPDEYAGASLDSDAAVRALYSEETYIELSYLIAEEFDEYVPSLIKYAELSSFLNWIRRNYPIEIFQEIITQPNLEIVLAKPLDEIQTDWLLSVTSAPNLMSDPELAEQWVSNLPFTPFSGDPNLPYEILKEGLRLYLTGDETHGLWEIRRAIDLDPGFALGYYTLGWIAYLDGDWEEAEEKLGMAILLSESMEEISWCHTMLAPIYLDSDRMNLAYDSLILVSQYATEENTRIWAAGLALRVEHILALTPPYWLERDSIEFGQMRTFFQDWTVAANTDDGVENLIHSLMDDTRASSIAEFYRSIRNEYPDVIFNHATQSVGSSESAIYAMVNIQALFPGTDVQLSNELAPLTSGGYTMMFQVVADESGWKVLDWENAEFPLNTITHVAGENLDVDALLEAEEIDPAIQEYIDQYMRNLEEMEEDSDDTGY